VDVFFGMTPYLFDSLIKAKGRITLVFCIVDYSIMMVLVSWGEGGYSVNSAWAGPACPPPCITR